jgi:ribosomal-protein-alanine N-acetyltransferase
VRIEPQQPDHAEGLFAALADPRIYRFLDDAPPASVAALRARIERQARGPEEGGACWLNWTVFRGARIVGYTQATIATGGTASIAYVLSPEVWGQGVAFAACRLMLRTLIERGDVRAFVADAMLANQPSRRLLLRLGFTLERETASDAWYRVGGAAMAAALSRAPGNR